MASKYQVREFDHKNMRRIKFVVYEEPDGTLTSVPYQDLGKDTRFGQFCLTLGELFMPLIRAKNIKGEGNVTSTQTT